MLKRFSVENFSSFKEETTLDLTSGRSEKSKDHFYAFKDVKLLKSAVIYGANASGKSNFIKSIDFAKKMVLEGLEKLDTYKRHFRLDKNSQNFPSKFEFELEIDNEFFAYGFSSILGTRKITEEWLFKIGTSSPKSIFERKNNEIELGSPYNKNDRFQIYTGDMKNRSNQLFLTEIGKKELSEKKFPEVMIFNKIFNWLDDSLLILYPETTFIGKATLNKNRSLSGAIKKYLREFDTGIVDISCIEEDFEETFKNIPDEIRREIEKDLSEKNVKIAFPDPNGNLMTISKTQTGELVAQKLGLIHSEIFNDAFELKDESDGTIRLLDLIPLITRLPQSPTILIDELDRSLHPKLTKEFCRLFFILNKFKAQLIVTTHESTLLDFDLFRQDEIWFAEKSSEGASNLFSLNKFQIRHDKKIEKAYLLGRYGAIPIFKDFKNIDWESDLDAI